MIRATRTQWIKFAVVLALYLIFLVWLRSWLGLVVVPFIFDAYSHWWRYTLSTSISSRTM